MSIARRTIFLILVVATAYGATRWWLNSNWSEAAWTWLNTRLGGQQPGLASDTELVLALLVSVGLAVCVWRLIFAFARRTGHPFFLQQTSACPDAGAAAEKRP